MSTKFSTAPAKREKNESPVYKIQAIKRTNEQKNNREKQLQYIFAQHVWSAHKSGSHAV